MNPCPEPIGDLKMVKVRKGRKGHRKSRSLVFRISRTARSDSRNCNTLFSSAEQQSEIHLEKDVNSPPCSLKMEVPELGSPSSITNFNVPETEIISEKGQLQASNDKISSNLNINTLAPDNMENGYPELRRSSRRILLKLKNCETATPVNEVSKIKENQETVLGPHIISGNKIQEPEEEKRKRGRKPGFKRVKMSELPAISVNFPPEKRKRRGRPPKYPTSMLEDFTIVQPVIPGKLQSDTEKILLKPPPKNSIWTLVPKELLESEFFKSQLLKVRFAIPKNNIQSKSIKSSSSSGSASSSVSFPNNEQTFKIPKLQPALLPSQQNGKTDDLKDYKRPTVIYFKNERKEFNNTDNQLSPQRSELYIENQMCKIQNDLGYLSNKYHMLEEETISNYYELACENLNEAERMLTELLAHNRMLSQMSQDVKVSRTCIQTSSSILPQNSIVNFISQVPISYNDSPQHSNSISMLEDVDTLTRKLIVESLRLLLDEESLLLR